MHRCQLFCHNQEIMQVAKHWLVHDGGSCRIETSPLICSSNKWAGFCIIGTSVMKDSRCSSLTYTESLFLRVVKHNLLFCFSFFFSIWLFFSQTFVIDRIAGEGGDYLITSFLPLSPASDTCTLAGLLLQRAHLCA